MNRHLGPTLHNIVAVARREFMFRGRTRTFRFTTALLVVVGIALALAPVIIRWIDRGSTGDRVEVVVRAADVGFDIPATLGTALNNPAGMPSLPGVGGPPAYEVAAAADVEASRLHVLSGSTVALLVVDRTPGGDLSFDLISKEGLLSRTAQLIRAATAPIAVQDRLNRAGLTPGDQAALFAPPVFSFSPADPDSPGRGSSAEAFIGAYTVAFTLSILLFMAIILYGQWVAFSVAEEKNSRVMEIVLAAATPFQLLAGKVTGVGALALVQYLIVLVPSAAAVLLQGEIAKLVLGEGGGAASLPQGLSLGLLAAFGVLFVLGFALYAVLYAGAASLVNRQEDVNQIVAPLTIISVGGYLVASYAGTGLIPIDAPLVVVLSYVPFFSPYLMLTRFGQGAASGVEVAVAILILAASIPFALGVAARLYRSGVLLYGQSPTPRTLFRALRGR